jgi:hypothetical protein
VGARAHQLQQDIVAKDAVARHVGAPGFVLAPVRKLLQDRQPASIELAAAFESQKILLRGAFGGEALVVQACELLGEPLVIAQLLGAFCERVFQRKQVGHVERCIAQLIVAQRAGQPVGALFVFFDGHAEALLEQPAQRNHRAVPAKPRGKARVEDVARRAATAYASQQREVLNAVVQHLLHARRDEQQAERREALEGDGIEQKMRPSPSASCTSPSCG